MIVRILGEGQLTVADSALAELNELDGELEAAFERGDEAAFKAALAALLGRVRELGTPTDPDALEPSELILPAGRRDHGRGAQAAQRRRADPRLTGQIPRLAAALGAAPMPGNRLQLLARCHDVTNAGSGVMKQAAARASR